MSTPRRIRLFLPLPVLAVAALVWPLSGPEAEPRPTRTADEVAYESLPDAPEGEVGVGRAGVETSAVDHAAWLRAVPSAKGSETPCDPANLYVSWAEPPATATHGRFIPPLGPAPTSETDAVNGIVQCKGAEDYAYMGFQARYAGGRWEIQAVPYIAEEDHLEEVTAPEPEAPQAPPVPTVVTLDGRTFGAAIEGLAAYEPQRTCSNTAKPGTLAMRNLLLRDNAGSRNLGIVRGCSIGGTSEHKEGRAFDWGVNARTPREKAYADAFVAKLLATDQHGNKFALARRMGVMYVIWNRQIWSAYRASDGWRPYGGASPHTDHVHISLSWAGANARTSFWSGNVVDVLLAAAPTGDGAPANPARRRTTLSTTNVAADRAARERRAAAAAAWEAERQKRRAEAKAAWEAEKVRREEARALWEAERQKRREARDAAEALADEERDRLRAEAKARYELEKAARDQARAEAKAKWEQEKAARDQARIDARAKWEQAKREAADKAAQERAARDQARREAIERAAAQWRDRRRRPAPTTTVPAPTTTTAPAPTTTTAPPAPTTTTAPPATTTTTAG